MTGAVNASITVGYYILGPNEDGRNPIKVIRTTGLYQEAGTDAWKTEDQAKPGDKLTVKVEASGFLPSNSRFQLSISDGKKYYSAEGARKFDLPENPYTAQGGPAFSAGMKLPGDFQGKNPTENGQMRWAFDAQFTVLMKGEVKRKKP